MKILIVDDHPLFVAGMRQILQSQMGIGVILTSEDAPTALKMLVADPAIGLVLLDLSMPEMDGLAFLEAHAQAGLLAPVVIVSASDNAGRIRACLDAGAQGFIPKSHPRHRIVAAMNRIQNGEVYIPDELQESIQNAAPQTGIAHVAEELGLTQRQLEVLELLARGLSNRGIAESLFISEHTVKSHLSHLFAALEVENRTACVNSAQERGLLS